MLCIICQVLLLAFSSSSIADCVEGGLWCFSSVQLISCVRLFATPRTAACQASLSITNSRIKRGIMLEIPMILCHDFENGAMH